MMRPASVCALPGASIVAKESDTGLTYEATADSSGAFSLKGLRPARYEITVSMDKYKPEARSIELPAGQTISLAFRVTPDVVYTELGIDLGITLLSAENLRTGSVWKWTMASPELRTALDTVAPRRPGAATSSRSAATASLGRVWRRAG